jgi:hypothetical protein
MSYEVEYEKNEKKEPHKPHFEEVECGEVRIKAENVYININCKEEKERKEHGMDYKEEKERKEYGMGYKEEYEKNEKKEPHKPHFEESECGEVKIYAENVYININCKEKKEKKEY